MAVGGGGQVQGFTSIDSTTPILSNNAVASTPSEYVFAIGNSGVSSNLNQDKMIFAYNGSIYYAISSNSGSSWSTFTKITLDTSTTSQRHACGLRNDGQYGFVITAQKTYLVDWTGSTPTCSSFDTTVAPLCKNATYFGASLTPDGLTLVVCPFGGTIYYSRFNGTGYTAFTTTGLTSVRMGVVMTADSKMLFGPIGSTNGFGFYSTVSWVGNTGTFSAKIEVNRGFDDRGAAFLGGNYTGSDPPKYVITGSDTSFMYCSWNQATKTLGDRTAPFIMGNDMQCYTPCGAKGNIIHYVKSTSIYAAVYNVT